MNFAIKALSKHVTCDKGKTKAKRFENAYRHFAHHVPHLYVSQKSQKNLRDFFFFTEGI